MAGLFGSASASTPTTGDLKNDVQVKDPPEDGITEIAFSPQAEYLAASSWDGKVRIYEIDGQGNSQGKALFPHEGPVLSVAWSKVSLRFFLSFFRLTQPAGWHQSNRRRHGQSSSNARSWLRQHNTTTGRRSRPTYPLRAHVPSQR